MICIISMPRSGSSMTAGIFHKHGVWVGPCLEANERNPKGFFECVPLKHLAIATAGRLTQTGKIAKPNPEFEKGVRRTLAEHGNPDPWLFKVSALYYPLFLSFKPKFVCVRRKPSAVIRSGRATGYFTNEGAVQPHIDAMDAVVRDHGGVNVYTDDVVAGDYSSLRRAIEHCGLKFDEAIVRDFVDPELWHYA